MASQTKWKWLGERMCRLASAHHLWTRGAAMSTQSSIPPAPSASPPCLGSCFHQENNIWGAGSVCDVRNVGRSIHQQNPTQPETWWVCQMGLVSWAHASPSADIYLSQREQAAMQWEKENWSVFHSSLLCCQVCAGTAGEKGEQGRCSMAIGSRGTRRDGAGREPLFILVHLLLPSRMMKSLHT